MVKIEHDHLFADLVYPDRKRLAPRSLAVEDLADLTGLLRDPLRRHLLEEFIVQSWSGSVDAWAVLTAYVGVCSFLYLGLATLSGRPGSALFNLTAGAGIFTVALLGMGSPEWLGLGILLHVVAGGHNVLFAREGGPLRQEPILGWTAMNLVLILGVALIGF